MAKKRAVKKRRLRMRNLLTRTDAAARSGHSGRRSRSRKTHQFKTKANPKLRKAPKGWVKGKAFRVVKRGGKTILEVKR